jgi:hemoglobin-like flavoprotein
MNIQDSLHRILASQKIFGRYFYETFFAQCPEARKYFEGVNIERQAVLLTMALVVIEKQHSCPYLAAEEYLKYLGTKHHDWRIPKRLYANWSAAMLATLAQFHGDDWEASVSQEWQEAIENVIGIMFQGYEQHFTV